MAAPVHSATNSVEFQIFWPLRSPVETNGPVQTPLLDGRLVVRSENYSSNSTVARLRIFLSRRSDEAARESWNSRLAFPQYDWMRYVKVWDQEKRWLWPNLAYLLRLHGAERVERYGGVDPGKGVDNDFAAVLVRKFDGNGREDPGTQRQPLVSAEWYPFGVAGKADKQTVVHTAQSDEFTLHLSGAGSAVIWLIYADFMEAPVPKSWPQRPEYAGGILACFELRWGQTGGHLTLEQIIPKRSTGFAWETWANRTRESEDPGSTAKLTDIDARRP